MSGNIKIFKAWSQEDLENQVNTFLEMCIQVVNIEYNVLKVDEQALLWSAMVHYKGLCGKLD